MKIQSKSGITLTIENKNTEKEEWKFTKQSEPHAAGDARKNLGFGHFQDNLKNQKTLIPDKYGSSPIGVT